MAAWSQSPFLQALGWAMLNSMWQMALLFAGFSILQQLVSLSTQRKYYIAIGALGAGLIWFIYTFLVFYNKGATGTLLLQHPLAPTSQTWNVVLSSASMAYLLLLTVPAYRLAKNWRYIEHLKKFGLQKTAMEYRLFVKKVAQQLTIKQTVHVYISHLVHSPVTIGYLKPIILLPLAAVNNLSTQQVEAVLLHELSHIKRYDYLINFIITLLQTLFYFNPFVKKFVSLIEFEREKCCDELVLQFQYDKISYASALLLLEKNMLASEMLTLGAASKNHLLSRIERILGLKRRARFTFHQFAGLMASFLVVLLINSLLFVNKEVKLTTNHVFTAFENPLYQYDTPPIAETFSKAQLAVKQQTAAEKQAVKSNKPISNEVSLDALPPEPADENLIPVAYDATDAQVSAAEKEHIEQTIETTKKVLTQTKWKEVEASIADGMTAREKKVAHSEYLKAINKINWKNLENHLKTKYDNLNWTEIAGKLDGALMELKLDSLQTAYHEILIQIEKTAKTKSDCKAVLPLPDISSHEVELVKEELKTKIDSIQVVRTRKIINF